jgi:hypothetical protein
MSFIGLQRSVHTLSVDPEGFDYLPIGRKYHNNQK